MENKRFHLNQANIVIVNQTHSNINELINILKIHGYDNVNMIFGYRLAIENIEKEIPDLILIYIDSHDLSVYELCENIKKNNKLKEVPVIFISEYEKLDKNKVFASGGSDYLVIPFNESEVIRRIGIYLRVKFMNNQLEKYENKLIYDELINLNEELKKENEKLERNVLEKEQQLEDITLEFNVLLEEEINERTKVEEALKENEKQFRYSIEGAPVPIMLYDEEGGIKKINKAWTNITGYTIDDMTVISKWINVSDIFKTNLFCTDMADLKTGEDKGKFFVKTKEGDIRIWNFYLACIGEFRNGYKLFIMIAIDITERTHMDELEKSVKEERQKIYELKEYDKIRTEFFSNISHELRTPINVIFSALQMFELSLRNYELESKNVNKTKYIKIMKQNCYRILRLINNLIDITKIDSGYFDINKQNVNIVSIVEDITLSVADYIENKGISLIFDTDTEEKVIACDPEKMERVILNLLSNAVKFTSTGGEITVNIEDCFENICIRVKDTGRGIPKEKLNSIFERFVQVDKSLTRDHEGSGIGLSLVKSLVELHGGTISVESNVKQGTEFTIRIPCELVDEPEKESLFNDSVNKSYVEKINIEFSDIYN
ncbi:multi-sensor signal transduction histidine kinase [Clostridium sp. DL-VIII]|uniref:ATP-binding protein n=1 Tax=Clostridium sp. DL-VIII TaxID=641107 RepID=UPI00023AF9CA|nr:ATP-binding protein [Clostridium sp. DL-VIII]EHI99336.1 multi-sensor signal transduction histidine kinase [Clostridium sp. DL-VIII]